MKILKPEVDVESWVIVRKCANCSSELEISSSDIKYDANYNSNYWVTTCIACDNVISIPTAELPKMVQKDILLHRRVKVTSSWD